MEKFYGHPDDPANPQGGTDIDNEQLEEERITEAELWHEIRRNEQEEEARIAEFELHNATDCFGNCFSDADPGL